MTLHEAIETLLKQERRPMTTPEIAEALNRNKYYQKGTNSNDPSTIKSSQIAARINKHPKTFVRNDKYISLKSEIVSSYPVVDKRNEFRSIMHVYSKKGIGKNGLSPLLIEYKRIKFVPKTDVINKIPDQSGNYIICLIENSKLPTCKVCPIMSKFEYFDVIYTGISAVSLRNRDYKQHFNGHAGKSTLRKSLGVLFGYKQIPRDKDPLTGKTKFSEKDEQMLSDWMQANLIMYVFPTVDFNELETQLINHFNPPLNLKSNTNTINADFRKHLSLLRTTK